MRRIKQYKTTFKDPYLRWLLKTAKAKGQVRRQDDNLIRMGNTLKCRSQPVYTAWRNMILRRDDYKCQECGRNTLLQVHHKISYNKAKRLRLKLSNGITLCYHCHKKIHPWLRMDTRFCNSYPYKAQSEDMVSNANPKLSGVIQ